MATDKFDYARLVSDIDAKIAALQALRASVQAAGAVGALGEAMDGVGPSVSSGDIGQPIDLPEGAFHGKSLPACVELYLSAVKRKRTIKEIAAALRDGGVESTSDNFENVVTGALFRLKKAKKVLRFKDGWGLPEWYPANIREAATSGGAKRTKKKAKKAQSKAKPAATASATPSSNAPIPIQPRPVQPEANSEGTQGRIIQFFKNNLGREVSASEVATPLGLKIQTAHFVLGKLAWKKVLEKSPEGNYKMVAVQ